MKTAVALIATALLAAPLAAQAPATDGGTLGSQQAALRILGRAMEAHGGYARLNAPGFARARFRIVQFMPGQEVRPNDTIPVPGFQPALFVTVTSDAAQQTVLAELFRSDTASSPVQRIVRTPGDRFAFRIPNNVVIDMDEAELQRTFRMLPYLPATLLAAWSRAETLRTLGRQTVAAQACDAITFTDASGAQTTLCVDARTGLLDASETLAPDEPLGLGVQRTTFSGYRKEGGLMLPSAARTTLGGHLATDITVQQVVAGVALDTTLLRRPEGATRAPGPPPAPGAPVAPGSIPVNQIAPGVFVLQNVTPGYNEMFVDMGDHVVVIEACGSPTVSESVLRTVGEQLPGKPVRSVVLTHHHSDHSGGLWTYMARGITVVTTPGNVDFVRSVAVAPRPLDGRVADAPQPKIETVARRRTLGSGPNAIELIDVGPNPHAEEILVAYMPGRKLLWVPDIYGYMPGFQPPEMLVSFAEALDRLGLDIETFVTAHTDPTTRAQYDEGVAQARSAVRPAGGR
jgi:hypothetical protein